MAKRPQTSPDDIDALAAEYVLGSGDAESRKAFEQLEASVTDAARARQEWENRLAALNTDYGEQDPPATVKQRIDQRLFSSVATSAAATGGIWNSLSLWRGLGLAGSAAAIALGVYSARLGDDLSSQGSELTAALEEKQEIEQQLQAFETEIASRGEQLGELEEQLAGSEEKAQELETQLAGTQERAEELATELATAKQRIAEADALLMQARADLQDALNRERTYQVVSLESVETDHRFLAVHEAGSDEVRMTLVSGDIASGQDYELWLVEPEVETVSLGVVPSGKTSVDLTSEQISVLEKGGLLAISIEQKGGSPTGVAQGPVVAVGAPNEL